jgi:hypothetical protein
MVIAPPTSHMFSLYTGDAMVMLMLDFPRSAARPVPEATLQEWATRPGRILARLLVECQEVFC